jgi:hypothetical protein
VAAGKILADGKVRSRKIKNLRKIFFGVTFWGNRLATLSTNLLIKPVAEATSIVISSTGTKKPLIQRFFYWLGSITVLTLSG